MSCFAAKFKLGEEELMRLRKMMIVDEQKLLLLLSSPPFFTAGKNISLCWHHSSCVCLSRSPFFLALCQKSCRFAGRKSKFILKEFGEALLKVNRVF